ncbi:hypothetical protein A9P44_00410 [Paenibacillus polymyxa]|nr:hypothetical protein [Paenibacillus polymyxa]OBA07849.1 hypothetical protein A9P44_00410 [Paenibacillus polymyxa]
MSVKDMTNQQLNDALRILLGWTKIGEHPDGHFGCWKTPEGKMSGHLTSGKEPDYCNDAAASLEVQAAACEVHPNTYIRYLEKIKWGQSTGWKVSNRVVAQLCNASPRERAEAAYMTLSSKN